MQSACKEAADKTAADQVINNINNPDVKTSPSTSKRHKSGTSKVAPTSMNKQPNSANRKKAARTFPFSNSTINEEIEFLLQPSNNESDDESVYEVYNNNTNAPAVPIKNVNPRLGVTKLNTAKTYNKLGWPNDSNIISTKNPGCDTNAIRYPTTLTSMLKIEVKPIAIRKIKNISNLKQLASTIF